MKRILSLLSFFLFILSFSQKAEINAKILFADGTDSNAKILFRKSIFYENEIYENSITQKNIFLINDAGKKEKHLFNKFRRIEFVDLKGQKRVFERPLEKFGMFELIQDGPKMKWYRDYTENSYDHSQGSIDILIKNDGKYEMFSILTNYKKKLKELTSDMPVLAEFIENCNFFNNTNSCLQEVFKKYNE
ncbi:hypothetical protein [Kaistella sp.]|uniref:hypothetical protein n=1 Tax=Kaistella sp. TaxID=2782235 RepID=UPI002F936E65